MTAERVFSLAEAAEWLRLDEPAVTRLATGRTPKLASIKTGRVRTFPESAIEAYIEANTIAAVRPNPHGLTDASLRRVRKGAAA